MSNLISNFIKIKTQFFMRVVKTEFIFNNPNINPSIINL